MKNVLEPRGQISEWYPHNNLGNLHENIYRESFLMSTTKYVSLRNKKKNNYFSVEKSTLFQAILSNIFTFIGHFYNLTIKIKGKKIYVSKNRIFRLV